MPKSRVSKKHKEKAKARNARILQDKAFFEKKKRELIMELIQKEKDKGLYNNVQPIDPTDPTTIEPLIGPEI